MIENRPTGTDEDIKTLLQENIELAKQNNELLRVMKRNNTISLVLRVVWYVVIFGIPFILYFYFVDPIMQDSATLFEVYGDLLP